MARLSLQQITELLTKPKNRDNISLAIKQERRLQLHTEAVQDRRRLNSAFNDFCAWVQNFLPPDKWQTFNKLITLPVPTNEQSETIYTELKKVFQSQDAQKQMFFVDPVYHADAEDYLQRQNISSFMQTAGWEAIKLQLCSFVVVDMPQQQFTPRPEPYTYIVNIGSVYDVDINEKLLVEYLVWQIKNSTEDNKRQFCVVDEEHYWILKENSGGLFDVLVQNPHTFYTSNGQFKSGLGYTPAKKVYPAASRSTNYIDSIGPITNQLGDFDWFWMEKVSYRYFALYGYYPIVVAYEEECNYREEETGNYCQNGRIEYFIDNGEKSQWKDCPKCAGKKIIGPGTFFTVKAPRSVDEVDLVKNPVTVIDTAKTDKLEFAQKSLEKLKAEIYHSTVGADSEPQNASAKNEDQVHAAHESREAVLAKLATNVDIVESFIYNTALILRYGNAYLGSNISKGSQFYLQSSEEADAAYAAAKAAGKPMHELEALRITANNIKNRNNPEGRQRIIIEQQLEPWCDLSVEEIQSLQLNFTNPEDYYIKINFSSYIARFEREHMSIVEFGSAVDFGIKIKAIQQVLYTYAQETIAKAKPALSTTPPVTVKAPIAA